jgi:hypothetical protein
MRRQIDPIEEVMIMIITYKCPYCGDGVSQELDEQCYIDPKKEYDEDGGRVTVVKLAEKGTIIGDFQQERTDAISEMFDNVDENGIYPTTALFVRLDAAVERAIERARREKDLI